MTKKELKQFVEMVEEQFNDNKEIIIEGYEQYLNDCDDNEYSTMCIESFGIGMIEVSNQHVKHLPFKQLYNFINKFRVWAKDRPDNIFTEKTDCKIEFYTDNFLQLSDSVGVSKLLNRFI